MKTTRSFEDQLGVDLAVADHLGREGLRQGKQAPSQCSSLMREILPRYSTPMFGPEHDKMKAEAFVAVMEAWNAGRMDEQSKTRKRVV